MKTIGIDLGTTTISLSVYDVEKELVEETITLPHNSFIQSMQKWEKIQNVEIIIKLAKDAVDKLLNQYSNVSAIGLTGQMHGILYLNSEGKAISPLFTWQDQRGNLKEFGNDSITELIEKNCHLAVPTGYGFNTHLYNIKKNEVPKDAVSLCTISDYLGMILTNRSKPIMHSSMAASLGFFDCKNNQFLTKELSRLGINTDILPKVTITIEKLGTYQGIPVTLALGDCQASFLGSVGLKEDTILLNIGTGSQVLLLSDHYFQTAQIEVRPFLDKKFLLCGSSLCGGRAYAILEHFFKEYVKATGADDKQQYEFMEKLAQEALSKSSDLIVKTTFNGTRSNPDEKGCILNLSEDNFTPGNLILGVLKGMVQELYDLYEEVKEGCEIHPKNIIASGNGFRKNPLLQQIAEEKFQLNLELAKHKEEAATGAAISSILKK